MPIRYTADPNIIQGPAQSVDLFEAAQGRKLVAGETASLFVREERPLEPIEWRLQVIRPNTKTSYIGVQENKRKYVAINIRDDRKWLKCVMCHNESVFANQDRTASFCSQACCEQFVL